MVSFEPSEEQQIVRDTVANFARDEIRPVAREADESGNIPPSLIQHAWELGIVQSICQDDFASALQNISGEISEVTSRCRP